MNQMYTAFVYWAAPVGAQGQGRLEPAIEEIDVEAPNTRAARTQVIKILEADYEPNWTRIRIRPFVGVTIHSYR